MKKIAFTQKIEKFKKYKETRDALDQRWVDFAIKLNLIPVILPNINPIYTKKLLDKNLPDIIVLTGGNDNYLKNFKNINAFKKRDDFEISIIKYAIKKKIPLIGVCKGMQLINIFFNGKISKINNHVKKNHKIHFSKQNKKKFSENVNSFHNWGIKENELGSDLIGIAFDSKNNIESFIHKNKKIIGIMWHPERYKKFNKKDIFLFKNLMGLS